MIFMFVLELLLVFLVGGLILWTARKMWKKADVDAKVAHLKLVEEQYEDVVEATEKYKDSKTKEETVLKFTKGE